MLVDGANRILFASSVSVPVAEPSPPGRSNMKGSRLAGCRARHPAGPEVAQRTARRRSSTISSRPRRTLVGVRGRSACRGVIAAVAGPRPAANPHTAGCPGCGRPDPRSGPGRSARAWSRPEPSAAGNLEVGPMSASSEPQTGFICISGALTRTNRRVLSRSQALNEPRATDSTPIRSPPSLHRPPRRLAQKPE